MRLVTYTAGSAPRPGALIEADTEILDLSASFPSMQALIEAGAAGLQEARALVASAQGVRVQAGSATLLAPLPVPVQVRDFMCFETHARQAGFNASKFMAKDMPDPEAALAAIEKAGPQPPAKIWFEQPVYYKGNRFAIAGTGADVIWPAYSKVMDYELEFAAIIGTKGVDIPVEEADAHIFGYTIYNDFSARDAQFREMSGRLGPAKGKDFDGGTILGPCIVTADEIANPYDLAMTARVNGELWTDGRSNSIQWTFAQMIAHVSQSETIYPGEVFGSGTVGNGCGLESMRFLQDGDVVELTVEKIGTIRNRVLAPHLRAEGLLL
jgi:2-keto-4-pentenoate hydratase/2-oxohepta-3-ene-1,7-dioic acid hydratase in catechol pathway